MSMTYPFSIIKRILQQIRISLAFEMEHRLYNQFNGAHVILLIVTFILYIFMSYLFIF